jgi:hypothetical protein
MKFRRNLEAEKAFRCVAIGGAFVFLACLVGYIMTRDKDLIKLVVSSAFLAPAYFCVVATLHKQFIEFKEDQIDFIANKGVVSVIKIEDIDEILIPTPVARKKRMQDNAIIFKCGEERSITSYTPEIESYVKENLNVKISYYDNYKKALK